MHIFLDFDVTIYTKSARIKAISVMQFTDESWQFKSIANMPIMCIDDVVCRF
jgi:hypothetical protein